MSTPENSLKSIFIAEDLSDFVNESQFLKESPKNKKQLKRKSAILGKEIINLVGQTNMNKKKKVNEEIEVCGESRQRILNVMSKQLKSRSHVTDNLLKNLSEYMVHFEADYTILKENVHKLKHFSAVSMKCINQTMAASKQKLRELQEIHSKFKKEVKGLLSHGAMKPDDRPLWFDVYKAFPPKVEPKFARPKPEVKTIRQILYKEDIIRAKFHLKGHGLSVNMLSPAGETQIRRLIQKYEQLESEGVSEGEIIEKSVAAVANEARQTAVGSESRQTEKHTPKNPESVTATVLAEANLKNIFKE